MMKHLPEQQQLKIQNRFAPIKEQPSPQVLVLQNPQSKKFIVTETKQGEEPELVALHWQAAWQMADYKPPQQQQQRQDTKIIQQPVVKSAQSGENKVDKTAKEFKQARRDLWETKHRCNNCRQVGHYVSKCPYRSKNQPGGRKCWNCGVAGHLSRCCTQPKKRCAICHWVGHDISQCRMRGLKYCAYCQSLDQHMTDWCPVPYCVFCEARGHHTTRDHHDIVNSDWFEPCGACGGVSHETKDHERIHWCKHCRGEVYHTTETCDWAPCLICDVHGRPCLCDKKKQQEHQQQQQAQTLSVGVQTSAQYMN